jgi:EDD domain protein, DegV family
MEKIAVATDTNSSITLEEANSLGIYMMKMPFTIDGEEYLEDVNCTYEEFCSRLDAGADVSTAQPVLGDLLDMWDELLKTYDKVIYIPMSSALSGSCETAKGMAQDYDGKVLVVDNKRISISQRRSVMDALVMIEHGMSAEEIKTYLENDSFNSSIYLAVNTLDLLKKSGRVTATAATIATIMNIKPVLTIQGGKLDSYAKERGMKKAEKIMLHAIETDREKRFSQGNNVIYAAYSGSEEIGKAWLEDVRDYFKDPTIELYRLPISIVCHVSTGVLGIGVMGYLS